MIPASGGVRGGLFVTGNSFALVASAGRVVAHEACGGGVALLGPTLGRRGGLDLAYELPDQRHPSAIAVAEDGGIAVVAFELEYLGDIDEQGATWLVMFDARGERRWKTLLAADANDDFERVAIGPDQVFVARRGGAVFAYARATGEQLWTRSHGGSYAPHLAALPSGGVASVAHPGRSALVAYDAAGGVRWSKTPSELGLAEISALAVAPDGSFAFLGFDTRAQRIGMLEADGTVRWSWPFGAQYADRVSSIATDGTVVVAAGDYTGQLTFAPSTPSSDTEGFVASVSASGIGAVVRATGPGTQRAYVHGLPAPDAATIHVASIEVEAVVPQLVLDGVSIESAGIAIVELAR